MEKDREDIQILYGDALQLLSTLAPGSVDLIVADPPYNLGKRFGGEQTMRSFEEYLDFSRQWLGEAVRLLKPRGTLYLFMGVRFISYLYAILERDLNLRFNSWIVWHYTQGMGKKNGFSPRHDDILMFTRTDRYKFNLDNVRVPQKYYRARNNMRGANPGDVWTYSHVHYSHPNRSGHPTQKPEGLIERMVLASSDEGDLVLDPFAGSGTTLRVCQQLRRRAIGIEVNPAYVTLAGERLSRPFTGFDSIDPRMERIPKDLRDAGIRQEYLRNHVQWFLKNHPDSLRRFQEEVKALYGEEFTDFEPAETSRS
ncbi:MAG: DNA-methyltransferase [Candidatus Promineifilaceae bacterium]